VSKTDRGRRTVALGLQDAGGGAECGKVGFLMIRGRAYPKGGLKAFKWKSFTYTEGRAQKGVLFLVVGEFMIKRGKC